MKFECSAQDLFYGLQNATRALSSRPAMQILEGVLLSCDEDGVLLQCSRCPPPWPSQVRSFFPAVC